MLRELILKIPQPIRFVTAGGTVAVVYLCTTLLLNTLGLDIQIAIPIGYCVGLVLQFSLQRYYVFANHDQFSLEIHKQLGRYIVAAAVQYGATAALTHWLPGLLGLNERIVYVGVTIVAAGVAYVVNRMFVFTGESPAPVDTPLAPVGHTVPGDEPLSPR